MRVLAKLRDPQAIAQTLADCGVYEYHAEVEAIRWVAVDVRDGAAALVSSLRQHPNVEIAKIDPGMKAAAYNAIVRDTLAADLSHAEISWAHGQVNAYRAWKVIEDVTGTRGSSQIKVGVIDTGHTAHADLPSVPSGDLYWGYTGTWWPIEQYPTGPGGVGAPGAQHTAGWGSAPDRVWQALPDGEAQPELYFAGHGMMCSAIIAAQHNGSGVAGMAPGVHLYEFAGYSPDLWNWPPASFALDMMVLGQDMVAAADAGMDLVNCSFGGYTLGTDAATVGDPVWDAITYAVTARPRMIVLAAALNEGFSIDGKTVAPGEHPAVICVGAQDPNGGKIPYSCWGTNVDVIAPTNCPAAIDPACYLGSGLPDWFYATDGGSLYASGTGTSSATPMTLGVFALAWSMNPALTRAQIIDVVLSTVSPFLDADCETVYFPGNNKWGHPRGVANAAKAVLKAKSTRAEFAGAPQPYIGFLSLGWLKGTGRIYRDMGNNTFAPMNPIRPQTVWFSKDASGNVTTRLGGGTGACDGSAATVWIELAGYVDGANASTVELWLGGTRLYSGPPAVIEATAASTGTPQRLTVVARAASGAESREAYDDVIVSSLASASFTEEPIADVVPGALAVADADATTGAPSGNSVVLDATEFVEWSVDSGLGGTFDLSYTKTGAGTVSVSVDGEELDPLENLITDTGAHPMQALAKPALGATYVDPSFGTTIRRISDVQAFSGGHSISPSYSSVQAWNCDETYLILYHDGNGMHLYDGRTYAWIKRLTGTGFAPSNETFFYWHPTDPKLVYFVSTSTRSVKSYNVETQAVTTVHDFTGTYSAITVGNDPMWRSWIRNRLGLVAGSASPYTQVVLDLDTGSVVATASVAMNTANAICMAPSGDRGFLHIGGSANEPFVYDAALTQGLEIPNISGGDHGSIGTSDGEDTFFNVQYGYQTPPIPGQITGQLLATSLVTRATRQILPVYPMSGTHISAVAHNKPGWLAVSIIGDSRNGQAYRDQELLLVNGNTGGLVYRIGHHRSTAKAANGTSGDYYAEPHPVISPSGSRVLFASNWSTNGGAVDSYVVELPT